MSSEDSSRCESISAALCARADVLWSDGAESEAIEFYTLAAADDYIYAIIALARIRDEQRDYPEAFRFYAKAADLGSPYAQYCVGTCLMAGQGVAKNATEALEWFVRASEQRPPGFSCAQYAVGVCYRNGDGVRQDYNQAINWFRKAAEQGLANAQCELADLYRAGKGTSQDFQSAAIWYEKAAKKGFSVAQFNIGVCYEQGIGVAKDALLAAAWFNKAATGCEVARQA